MKDKNKNHFIILLLYPPITQLPWLFSPLLSSFQLKGHNLKLVVLNSSVAQMDELGITRSVNESGEGIRCLTRYFETIDIPQVRMF